ncbi:MAG: HAD-IIIA family hydrolase [Chloroflexia bacterium]
MDNKSTELKAVLFDLDGTLIHSVDHIVDCWQHTGRTCLGREMTREEILPTLGRTLYDAFEEIAPGRSEELYQVYRAHQIVTHDTAVTLVDGAKETLTALKEAGLLLGVVTAKKLVTAMRGLDLFDLAPFFNTIVTLEDSSKHKPSPEPLLVAAQRLDIAPEQAIYVGDARVDIEAGNAAGMRTAWVTWGAGTLLNLQDVKPDFIFDSMSEVVSLTKDTAAQRQ